MADSKDAAHQPAMSDLLQAHPVATLLIDGQGTIVEANQAAEALFNRARAALIDRPAGSVIIWREGEGLSRMLAEPGKSVWAYSVELSIHADSNLFADIALGPINPAGGWRVMAIHPVPKGGRMPFRRPGSAARSAGAAAAMLAHEIKNPLSGIRGAAQLLGKGSDANASALSRLICGEVDRIAGLIDSMQGFTRDQALSRTSINIYPAIGQSRGIAAQGFANGARFIEEFDPSLPRVLGNHDALVQILINLIKNACEAASDISKLQIRIATAYRHGLSWDAGDGRGHQPLPVEIMVADNGPGVPDHLVDALFDPFVTGKKDGQGLGLALVDKLVRDMGGVVQHDRTAGWTRFRLHLPVAVDPPAESNE
ncbi:two-component system sensor histidine kinase NtrB [Sphingomonas lacunae]|nr:ATP-binding protein [Sphingomonas lacunae]